METKNKHYTLKLPTITTIKIVQYTSRCIDKIVMHRIKILVCHIDLDKKFDRYSNKKINQL